jgi:selenocysteine lyase/cysteine desulfurase
MPILFGGTGSQSLRQGMPDFLPDRLEAGTHNVPGIAGLLEGLRFVRRLGVESILAHERKLTARVSEELRKISGVEVFCARDLQNQSGVCSFRLKGMDCEELGEKLGERGVAVRAGLHCAPLAHQTVGTLESGTVRVSFSAFSTEEEIEEFCRQLGELTRVVNKL